MAMTYGEAAPVPLPSLAMRVLSLEGSTIPTQRAPPMKKTPKRIYTALKARFTVIRGSLASPATMAIYSGPTMAKLAAHRAERKPSHRPMAPPDRYSTNGP